MPCCGIRGVLQKVMGVNQCGVCGGAGLEGEDVGEGRISYLVLKDELRYVQHQVRSGSLSTKEAVRHLKEYGVNQSIERLIVDGTVPAVWDRGLDIGCHVDVPMHLLFLGVGKSVLRQVHRWLRLRRKESSFFKVANEKMDAISSMHLFGWLNTAPYGEGGNFGGWVAESYVAACRFLPWLLLPLESMVDGEKLGGAPEYCTVTELWLFVQQRGWKADGGKRVLVEKAECIVKDRVAPRGGYQRTLMLMVHSWIRVLECGMIKTVKGGSVLLLRLAIYDFLDVFAELDDMISEGESSGGKSDMNAKWLRSYNFLSLLNLPDVMERFGPLCVLWEGGMMGEGILRKVKPY